VNGPVPPTPDPPLTRWRRLLAWLHMLFVDHAMFRFFFNTRSRVADDCYRSSHPMPYQLRAAARAGVRSVLSLRGNEQHIGSNVLERETCRELGLVLANQPIGSRDPPERAQLLRIKQLFDELPRPLLLHCKSGADRAGLVSALYLLLEKGQTPESAMRQLSFWRYGHVRQAKTGVLDHFFETYCDYYRAHGTGFMDWVEHCYDREAVRASFHSSWWANKLVDGVLRRE
jgi:protein tyrosine/serine phosphatase